MRRTGTLSLALTAGPCGALSLEVQRRWRVQRRMLRLTIHRSNSIIFTISRRPDRPDTHTGRAAPAAGARSPVGPPTTAGGTRCVTGSGTGAARAQKPSELGPARPRARYSPDAMIGYDTAVYRPCTVTVGKSRSARPRSKSTATTGQ